MAKSKKRTGKEQGEVYLGKRSGKDLEKMNLCFRKRRLETLLE
jgi:hypothetical protein